MFNNIIKDDITHLKKDVDRLFDLLGALADYLDIHVSEEKLVYKSNHGMKMNVPDSNMQSCLKDKE